MDAGQSERRVYSSGRGGQHPRLKLLFGTTGLALLLLALVPRSSFADVPTKMNLRNNAGGVEAASGVKEQPSGLLREAGPFNKNRVDGLDIENDGEDEKSVSLTVSD